MKNPDIYCILITGKNEDRYKFIPLAIENFKMQTYKYKKLLIINHGSNKIKTTNKDYMYNPDIIEINIEKGILTLGDIRNYALDIIPLNALWTVWDDDDWRSKVYLEEMYKSLVKYRADVVFFKNRLEYNILNNFAYQSRFNFGMPFILSKKIEKIRYLPRESLEDVDLHVDYLKADKKVVILDNDPRFYIRIIHESNTSLYVNNQRNFIVNYSDKDSYHEYEINKKDYEYCRMIVDKYYKF